MWNKVLEISVVSQTEQRGVARSKQPFSRGPMGMERDKQKVYECAEEARCVIREKQKVFLNAEEAEGLAECGRSSVL